jgi:NADH-quinone oxidoreductase subunit N
LSGQNWILLGALIIGSAIGIYYYLRVVYYMSRRPEEHHAPPGTNGGLMVGSVSCVLIAAILLLGTLPQSLMAYLRSIL